MTEEQQFIRDRAEATGNVQVELIAKWVWSEKPTAQWKIDVAAVDAREREVGKKEAAVLAARGDLDVQLIELHDRDVQMLGMARIAYRRQPSKLVLLQNLSAVGNSRKTILGEARDLLPAWAQLDITYAPVATNTYTLFKGAYDQAIFLSEALKKAEAAYQEEAEILEGLCRVLQDDCVAWYGEAGRVFKAGTVEGNLIRSEIPTRYVALVLPGQAEITDEMVSEPGGLGIGFKAKYARRYDVLRKGPLDADYVLVAQDATEDRYEATGLAAGLYTFKVMGKNAKGSGMESEPVTVTVV
jgi:hypothetical protein